MYDKHSLRATEFIDDEEIRETLCFAQGNKHNKGLISSLIERAADYKGLIHREAAALSECNLSEENEKMFTLAKQIKQKLYGNRIVMFTPLYLSNYCASGCVYCPYRYRSKYIRRKRLTQEETRQEVTALQGMGHKRLALGTGEDPVHSPIEYVLKSIKAIYGIKHKDGAIHRVNINITATTVDNYRELKEAGIDTYVLLQETYNRQSYEQLHPSGPKSNYTYHTEAMDRAMEGGTDDVGCGVLFGLDIYRYSFVGLLMHAEHLEAVHGAGSHTISVSRICPADDINPNEFSNVTGDEIFTKIVAVLRIAVPYTGMIIPIRGSQKTREKVLDLGIPQISGASSTSVGGYVVPEKEEENSVQFDVNGSRTLDEVASWLLKLGYIPNFCTIYYREGRTGGRSMSLVKFGQTASCRHPNTLSTLWGCLDDYVKENTKKLGSTIIDRELLHIPNERARGSCASYLRSIDGRERDPRF